MTGTSSNEVRYNRIAEATPGTIPATPAWDTLRTTTLALGANPNRANSEMIVNGGQITDSVHLGFEVGGQRQAEVVYGDYDADLESLLMGTWASDVLINGSDVHTFSYELNIPEGGVARYYRFRGVEPSAGTLTFAAESIAQIQLDLIGTGVDAATADIVTGATYTNPPTGAVLSSGRDVGFITMSGFTVPCIRSLTLNIAADKRRQPRISSDDLCGIGRGAPTITADVEFYIEAGYFNIYNAMIANSEFAMTIPVGSTTGEKYVISLPRCRISGGQPEPGGRNTDVFANHQITALYDTGIAATIQITRAVA